MKNQLIFFSKKSILLFWLFNFTLTGFLFSQDTTSVTDNNLNAKEGIDFSDNITLQYDYVYYFSEGMAAVEIENKWGFIDTNGTILIPAKYERTTYFINDLSPVKINGKWGYLNKKGELIIPAKYEDFGYFDEDGKALVTEDGKKKINYKKGERPKVVSITDSDISLYSEGLMSEEHNGNCGCTDRWHQYKKMRQKMTLFTQLDKRYFDTLLLKNEKVTWLTVKIFDYYQAI